MPTVKGGIWTNIEDEVLKASVSKYGLNQWARVSSLLARKTPKQCKARWSEWLDPSIRKIEWSKEEDEKLLHLAKLLPTQWRTIAPIVGRTATQCLERYQKLLDDAEARENDELGLGGPDGGENKAPSADDVRRLRPGELDPDPESKPARPDTIDLDEDEKEMLSEARARLANTKGKKAKRKARERQLEESRRLAALQKRRELKTAGINVKVTTRKPGQMDYNADIPFEKAPAPGLHDTSDESKRNEREREFFDPRKQQLANKRKNDEKDEDGEERKRRKSDNKDSNNSAFAAAQRAGQLQRIREAERSSKRRALVLPAPQVGQAEIEGIVKMGKSGQRASEAAQASDNDATRSLVGAYGSNIPGATPMRTPRAPQGEDRIANEVRNARARTETQSALLGGDNPDIHEGNGTTGYAGATPTQRASATPNPLATPYRTAGAAAGPGQTPLRTPRDNFRLNDQTPASNVPQTPRDLKLAAQAARSTLSAQLAALPQSRALDIEFDVPDEEPETESSLAARAEDAALRDARARAARIAAERADFARQTQVVQRALPRPSTVDADALLAAAQALPDPSARAVALEAARLIVYDARRFGAGVTLKDFTDPSLRARDDLPDEALDTARLEIALEAQASARPTAVDELAEAWEAQHAVGSCLPGLDGYGDDDDEEAMLERAKVAFTGTQARISRLAADAAALEKKLGLHLGGYVARSRTLRGKAGEAAAALEAADGAATLGRWAMSGEKGWIGARLETARESAGRVATRERVAQEAYRVARDELATLR